MAGKEDYIYAVTRVHMNERNLLSRQDLEQLVAAKNAAEVFRMLADKDWGTPNTPPNDADALVAAELEKTWGLVQELTKGAAPFDVFRCSNDFHNLKAAIKLEYTASANDAGNERYFINFGNIELETILAAAKTHDFSSLPPAMAQAGQQAYEALAQTGNGQACDMAIDRFALVAVYEAGKASGSKLLQRYAELTVDSANIKAAVRCCLMKKNRDFIERAVAPAGTLNTNALIDAATHSLDDIYECLRHTSYEGAVDALKTSMADFERWCDNQMIEMIRPQRFVNDSVEPLAAFILGRENEIRMVRLILSAKINQLSSEALRERLRDTYV